jgi:hypothetical protein
MMRTALLATALFAAPAALAVPMTFTHQGRIADAAGRPVNGEQTAIFRLYSEETNALPWTETHQVSLNEGYYSVELCVQTPLDTTGFNTDELWFGIPINGSTFDQLMALSAAGRLTSRGACDGPLRLAVTTDSCHTISVGAARHLPNSKHRMALSTVFSAQRTRATRWAWFVYCAAPWSQWSDEGRVRQSGCTEWCGRQCRS